MRSIVPMRMAKIGYIVLSVVRCALGVWFILCPEMSVSAIGITMGIVMILFGAVKLVGYFSKDLFRLAFQHDLAMGILQLVLGCVLIFRASPVINILCALLGVYVLADALVKVQIAVDSRAFGLEKWWMILTSAIVTGVLGVLLVLRPSESAQALMILLGVSLITEGVMNMITVLVSVKMLRDRIPMVIDADA